MADILNAVGNIFQGVSQAFCSVFQLMGAFGRLNTTLVNGIIDATKDCCLVLATIGTSLWAAVLDILFYIADFFLEVFGILNGCLRLLSKFGMLVFVLVNMVLQAVVIVVQWLLKALAAIARCGYQGALAAAAYVVTFWQQWKSLIFDASSSTAETAAALGNNTISLGHQVAAAASDFIADVGAAVNHHVSSTVTSLSTLADNCCSAIYCYVVESWSWLVLTVSELKNSIDSVTFPDLSSIASHTQDYFRTEFPLTDLLVLLLVPSGSILLIKLVMGYLSRKGMTFPLPGSSRTRTIPQFRPRYFIDSSDEDLTEGYDDVEEDDDDEIDDDDAGNIAIYAAGLTDDSDPEQDELGGAYDEDSEVDEYEVVSDSDDSEEESEYNITVELPQTSGRYNLRERNSPDPVHHEKLSPQELERVLESERDKRLCVVCADQPKTVVVLPCKHMCMCVDCAHEIVKLRSTRRVCPLCRASINTVMHIYA